MRIWVRKTIDAGNKRADELMGGIIKGSIAEASLGSLNTVTSQLAEFNSKLLSYESERSNLELARVNKTVSDMGEMVRSLEKDRIDKFAQLAKALDTTHDDHKTLATLTQQLHSVIYQKQARGQWGERMADDILRIAGFQEGVNYSQQTTLKSGSRPDYTFYLPNGLTVNMDVKFPLENYSNYVNADDKNRDGYMRMFISDVKKHIKELSQRDYAAGEATLDYVIMFIPSDLIYSVIFQESALLMDEALHNKVVLCSPSTLYAVLAVIRQAVDNYKLEKSTEEILNLMDVFLLEWEKFGDRLDTLGGRIDAVQKEYSEVAGVRKRQLERPLRAFRELLNRKEEESDE